MKKLLIIGAGGHGQVVKEIAEAIGYNEISFLDDNNSLAIGKISEITKMQNDFKEVFVGIGNNEFRGKLIKQLQELGFNVPVLIHPTAYISKSASIGMGTVVEPKAIVNANTIIGSGCIISVGAIVDHNVNMGDNVHANAGSITKAGATVESFRKLEAGEVVLGYACAVVKK